MAEIYEKLRERLDMFPQGFPSTESGVEIEILKELFSPEEAEIMLYLRPSPEPVSAVAGRMERDEKELAEKLYDMSRRGLILRFRVDEENALYFLAPWVVGIWEFQVTNLNDENIKLYEKYHEEGIAKSRSEKRLTPGFRVVPVEQEIQEHSEIESYERVSEIIESSTRFAVADCICRKEAKMFGRGCDRLMEGCMMFDMAADYYIENGFGRELTKEEAFEVLAKAEEDGLVHHSSNHQGKKIFICNCCGCCCKAMAAITKRGNLDAIARSNYYAVVDADECNACELCIDRCQVDAIQMEDDIAEVDLARCVGCALCVPACPMECITMARKEGDAISPIFPDDVTMMQRLSEDTNKPYPFE